MAVQRRQYRADFKREAVQAVRVVTEKGLSLAQAARDLGIDDNLLSRGKRQLETQKLKGTKPFLDKAKRLMRNWRSCGVRWRFCARSATF